MHSIQCIRCVCDPIADCNSATVACRRYGESNKYAEAYFTLANKLAPTILFIDEIDCLFRSHSGGYAASAEHEATSMLKAQFLSLWDGAHAHGCTCTMHMHICTMHMHMHAHAHAPCTCVRRACSRRSSSPSGLHVHSARSHCTFTLHVHTAGLLSPGSSKQSSVVVIAATNRPGDVDEAILRRLPLSFQVDLPAISAREDVLKKLLRDEPLARGAAH